MGLQRALCSRFHNNEFLLVFYANFKCFIFVYYLHSTKGNIRLLTIYSFLLKTLSFRSMLIQVMKLKRLMRWPDTPCALFWLDTLNIWQIIRKLSKGCLSTVYFLWKIVFGMYTHSSPQQGEPKSSTCKKQAKKHKQMLFMHNSSHKTGVWI